MFMRKSILILFTAVFLLFVAGPALAGKDLTSPLSIYIQLDKDIFNLYEPVEGKITVKNTYPAPLPAIFQIKIFHNGKIVAERQTSIKRVPEGNTEFSFKSFGIPTINLDATVAGEWQLKILQKNLPESEAKQVHFQILPKP